MSDVLPAHCFFAMSESREAGVQVARAAEIALTPLEERAFEGGEFKLRPLESVRNRIAFVYQSLAGTEDCSVSARLLRLLFLLGGLRDAGAERCIALVPYLSFARKDRRTQLRDPVNTRYVAQLLEAAGADRIVALDVHNPAAFDNAFRIPTDHLTALPMFAEHFAARFPDSPLVVASPDVGGIKRAQIFRELLEERLGRPVQFAFIEKRRAAGIVSGGALVGMDTDRATVILLDDLCATGGTLIRAAQICRDAGAAAVQVVVTHAPLPQGMQALQDAATIDAIVVTDSTGAPADAVAGPGSMSAGKQVTLPIAPLFGAAVRRMLTDRPLSPLLRRWPVTAQD